MRIAKVAPESDGRQGRDAPHDVPSPVEQSIRLPEVVVSVDVAPEERLPKEKRAQAAPAHLGPDLVHMMVRPTKNARVAFDASCASHAA